MIAVDSTGIVRFIGDITDANGSLKCNEIIYSDFKLSDFTIYDISEVPKYAVGNYSYTNGVFTLINNIDNLIANETKATIPKTITPRQARLALYGAGLLDSVEAAVATNKEYQIFWEYSLEIKRDDAILNAMATSLGLTERQVDDLFIAGSKL